MCQDTFGEDAKRCGRDARAPQFQKHLHTLANLAELLHKRDSRDGSLQNSAFVLLPPGKGEDGSKCGTDPFTRRFENQF